MSIFLMLLIALVLDAVLGEPEAIWDKYPHPATVMGRAVNWFDETLNQGTLRRIKGIASIIALCFAGFIIGWIIQWLPDFGILEILGAAILLAHKSLIQHVEDVAHALRSGLHAGRASVSMIVGRDSHQLDETGVARSAIESAAENFSDAVVAPAFWFLLGGLPGILVYKLVNTADSMIGYQNKEYGEFGYGAAKLDDLMNWFPARITAVLICAANFDWRAFEVVREDAGMHRSPNAGWPEAAVAGVLNIALAGPRSYDGEMNDDPFVNASGKKDLHANDIEDTVAVINRSWLGLIALLSLVVLLGWLF
ncbi:MAG: adenosylcobinamide-phosphate synthase CbiB [Rhodobacteraceae bacterium]|nr:adenosylcobinamide-phosphate synthase CbiB [Paracoccaceae bacterium]